MKIDAQALSYINNVLKVADIANLNHIAIESNRVRGMDENQRVFLLQTDGIPEFAFGSIGLNRLPQFVSRYDMTRTGTNFSMEATVEANNGNPFVRSLTMKSKGLKVDYRCANPLSVIAPKSIGKPFVYQFTASEEIALYLQKGQAAYNTEHVTFIGTEEGVVMEMADINNDKMQFDVADSVEILTNDVSVTTVDFRHKYPIKLLLPIIKAANGAPFTINTQGIARIAIAGFSVHLWAVQ